MFISDDYYNIIKEAEGKIPYIDDKILNIFNKYGYSNISPNTDIIDIKVTDDEGVFNIRRLNKKGKEVTQNIKKIGGVLSELFPSIDVVGDSFVQKMINELRTLSNKIVLNEDFDVYDDIIKWYKELHKIDPTVFHSCVTGREQLLEGMDRNPNIQIVIMKDKATGKPKGRALLWNEVQDRDTEEINTYLDRCYPNNDEYIKNEYVKWATSKGYWYRTYQGATEYENISGKTRRIRFLFENENGKSLKFLPYLDTFRNIIDSKEMNCIVVSNYRPNNSQWWADREYGMDLSKEGKVADDFRIINNWRDPRQQEQAQQAQQVPEQPQPEIIGSCWWCDRDIFDGDDYFYVYCEGDERLCCQSCFDEVAYGCERCGNTFCSSEVREINHNTGEEFYMCAYCAENSDDVYPCTYCSFSFDENHVTPIANSDNIICYRCIDNKETLNGKFVVACENCKQYYETNGHDDVITTYTDPRTFKEHYTCSECISKNTDVEGFLKRN